LEQASYMKAVKGVLQNIHYWKKDTQSEFFKFFDSVMELKMSSGYTERQVVDLMVQSLRQCKRTTVVVAIQRRRDQAKRLGKQLTVKEALNVAFEMQPSFEVDIETFQSLPDQRADEPVIQFMERVGGSLRFLLSQTGMTPDSAFKLLGRKLYGPLKSLFRNAWYQDRQRVRRTLTTVEDVTQQLINMEKWSLEDRVQSDSLVSVNRTKVKKTKNLDIAAEVKKAVSESMVRFTKA